MTPLRIIDRLNSSRRMMFENVTEGFEYSGRGTCFLCRYQNCDFVVTARHVVDSFQADSVRILFHQEAREFIPHNAEVVIKAEEDESATDNDTDWRDIVIYPLERSLYRDEQFADQQPYLIPHRDNLWRPDLGGHFIMRGFPHDVSGIDYEKSILREQAVIVEADFVGPSSMKHCSEIKFRDLSHCTNLDGLSGTPVFWVGQGKPRHHRIAGMIVRASISSGIGHFVDGNVILSALDKLSAQASS